MIILRYIVKQLLSVWISTTAILLFVLISSRFTGYLRQAALGELESSLIFTIIFYRIPGFLEIIMPLAFFISILVVYGRLYADNEIIIMNGCGITSSGFFIKTSFAGLVVFLSVGFFTFFATPFGIQKAIQFLTQQKESRAFLGTTKPETFHTVNNYTYLIKNINRKTATLNGVFIVQSDLTNKKYTLSLYSSNNGIIYNDYKSKSIRLKNGYKYDLTPGESLAQITKFDEYGINIRSVPVKENTVEEALTFNQLLKMNTSEAKNEINWRISLLLMIPIGMLIALPLSKLQPRQGRYYKLLPSILFYLIYLVLLISLRGAPPNKWIKHFSPLYVVDLLFAIIGLLLFYAPILKMKYKAVFFKKINN